MPKANTDFSSVGFGSIRLRTNKISLDISVTCTIILLSMAIPKKCGIGLILVSTVLLRKMYIPWIGDIRKKMNWVGTAMGNDCVKEVTLAPGFRKLHPGYLLKS